MQMPCALLGLAQYKNTFHWTIRKSTNYNRCKKPSIWVILNMAAANEDCGCSGIRKCLLCEDKGRFNKMSNIAPVNEEHTKLTKAIQKYKFCIFCGGTFPASQKCLHQNDVEQDKIKLEGITVISDFVNEAEEQSIVTEIDKSIWKPSQSGRRKQVNQNSNVFILVYRKCRVCISPSTGGGGTMVY